MEEGLCVASVGNALVSSFVGMRCIIDVSLLDMSLDTVSLTTERGKDVVEHNGRLYRKENGAKGAYRSSLGTKVTTYYVCCFSKCKGRLSKIQPCNPMTGNPIGESHFEEKRTESVLSAHSESCVPDCT